MGIQVEFNPSLALRAPKTKGRLEEECVPESLITGETYYFLKSGQRNYWMGGEIPLHITEGEGKLSRPIASVTIIESTHYLNPKNNKPYTKGYYIVNETYDTKDPTIHFEGTEKVK